MQIVRVHAFSSGQVEISPWSGRFSIPLVECATRTSSKACQNARSTSMHEVARRPLRRTSMRPKALPVRLRTTSVRGGWSTASSTWSSCAEPHFLGLLRGKVDDTTAKLVVGTVPKDLADVDANELKDYLADIATL